MGGGVGYLADTDTPVGAALGAAVGGYYGGKAGDSVGQFLGGGGYRTARAAAIEISRQTARQVDNLIERASGVRIYGTRR